jgi:cell division protein FtsZ
VLDESLAPSRVQIGEQLTQGLGAGGDAEVGRKAAEEDADAIGRALTGSDLVFIAAGLGGGTGSGAAPVIAAQARAAGALTVGVVTKPFAFEGAARRRVAEAAAEELRGAVDTLLLIENDRVTELIADDTPMVDAFKVVNEVLGHTVRAIVDIMTVPGLINLDFADVRTVMRDGGTALTGIGWAHGDDRAVEAARAAIGNPLLDHDIRGARAILLNVAGASGMTMREVSRAAEEVRAAADPDAVIIFGAIFDDRLRDDLRVTVIATRFADVPGSASVGRPRPAAAHRTVRPKPAGSGATPIAHAHPGG